MDKDSKCPSCECTAYIVKEGGYVRAQCNCTRSSIESSEAEALSDWYSKAHKPESREMKYIIVLNEFGQEVALIFSKSIQHATVANGTEVIAGGFFCLNGYEVTCYGKSVSLDVSSRESDSKIIWDVFFKKAGW